MTSELSDEELKELDVLLNTWCHNVHDSNCTLIEVSKSKKEIITYIEELLELE